MAVASLPVYAAYGAVAAAVTWWVRSCHLTVPGTGHGAQLLTASIVGVTTFAALAPDAVAAHPGGRVGRALRRVSIGAAWSRSVMGWIAPRLDIATASTVQRKVGDLRPRELRAISLELWEDHVDIPDAPVDAVATLGWLTYLHAASRDDPDGAGLFDASVASAVRHLREFVEQCIVGYGHPMRWQPERTSSRARPDSAASVGVVVRAVAVPLAVWASIVAIPVHAWAGVPAVWAAASVGGCWCALYAVRWADHRKERAVLLADGTLRRLDAAAFEEPPGPRRAIGAGDIDAAGALEGRLLRRRLVVIGGGDTARAAEAAYAALSGRYAAYRVVRPAPAAEAGRAPLTRLLSRGVLPARHRYVLWLGDVGRLLEQRFEPDVVERWLARGRGRIAVGTVSPADLRRIRAGKTPAARALARVVDAPEGSGDLSARTRRARRRRYRRQAAGPAGAVLRLVGVAGVLGLRPRPANDYVDMIEAVDGRRPFPEEVAALHRGAPPALVVDDRGAVSHHSDFTAAVEQDLGQSIADGLLAPLTADLSAEELLAVGLVLGARGQAAAGQTMLRRAQRTADESLQREITRALVTVLTGGVGSAALVNRAAHVDAMSQSQRDQAKQMLPKQSDGVFDPTLPPAEDDRTTRFYRRTLLRSTARVVALIVLDVAAVMLATAVAAYMPGSTVNVGSARWLTLAATNASVTVMAAVTLGLYRAEAARARPQQILATMAISAMLMAASLLALDVNAGCVSAPVALFVVGCLADCAVRYLYDRVSQSWVRERKLHPLALVLGPPGEARACAADLAAPAGRPVQPVAYLSRRKSAGDEFCIGRYAQMTDFVHGLNISEVVICDREMQTSEKAKFISDALDAGADVRFVANAHEAALGVTGHSGEPNLVHVAAIAMRPEALHIKRLLDFAIVTVTLPLWLPVIGWYTIYSAARRRGQPIIVPAYRVGLGETGFTMLRLRTRTVLDDRSRGAEPTGRIEALFERVGLDEFPQVVNVLRGEMSLVGPRPLAAEALDDLTSIQKRTFNARPGMTGPWQLAAPAGARESEMRDIDAGYLRRWRVTTDLDLIVRTPIAVARRPYVSDTEIDRRRSARPAVDWHRRPDDSEAAG